MDALRDAHAILVELIDTGLSAQQVKLAVELALSVSTRYPPESPPDTTADRRREWDRNYKRRKYLERKSGNGISPPDSPPEKTAPTVESLSLNNSLSKRRKKGSRLSNEARLSEEGRKFALSRGFSEVEILELWNGFVDYWIARAGAGGSKLDWEATWRNWIRKQNPRIAPVANANPDHWVTRETERVRREIEQEKRARAAKSQVDGRAANGADHAGELFQAGDVLHRLPSAGSEGVADDLAGE